MPAFAQNVVILRALPGGQVNIAAGAKLAIPLQVDMSSAGSLTVGGLTEQVLFDQTRFTFDSLVASSNYSDFTGGSNGFVRIFSIGTISSTTNWVTLWFSATAGSGGSAFAVSPTFLHDGSNVDIISSARMENLNVCIASSSLWGDANGDLTVNIIDAQQLARHSVGLSVANPAIAAAQGDVNIDTQVNIIDAQQVARYSVGLSAVFRVNTSTSSPTTSTMTITSVLAAQSGAFNPNAPVNLAGMLAGTQAQVIASAKNAVGSDITPCGNVRYSSSNPAVASITSTGLIDALAAGTTTITASSGNFSANTNVVVVSPYTTISWTNPAGGNWNVASNWSLNRVPQAGDSAVIALAGNYTVSVSAPGAASFVSVGGAGNTTTFNLGSQTLTLAGGVTVNSGSTFNINAGTLAGTGTLVNNGFITMISGAVNLAVDNRGTITQRSNATFAGAFTNAATGFVQIFGDVNCCSATMTFAANVDNLGQIQMTANGTASATLQLSSSSFTLINELSGVISVAGTGTRILAGNTVNLGLIDVSGGADLTVTAALVSLTGGNTTLAAGRTLNVNGSGVLSYNGGAIAGGGALGINSGGTLLINTDFTFNGALTINGGQAAGGANLIIPAAQTATIIGAAISAPVIVQGTLLERSTSSFSSGITVAAGGFFRVLGDPNCCAGVANVSNGITNSGSVELSSINGSNSATLTISSGVLLNSAGGVIRSLAGTGGTRTLNGVIDNQSQVDATSADLTILGTITNNPAGSVTIPGGRTVTIGSGASFVSNGGSVSGSGTFAIVGGITVNTALTPAVTSMTLAGSISGGATLNVPVGTTFTATNASITSGFVNQGLTITRGTVLFSAVPFTNAAGAIFRIIGDPSCCAGNAQVSFVSTNAGTIELTSTGGSNTATLTLTGAGMTNQATGLITALPGTGGPRGLSGTGPLTNLGVVDVSTTKLTVAQMITNSAGGTFTVATGDTLQFNAGSVFASAGGALLGTGTLFMNGGTFSVNSNLTSGIALLATSGTTINGAATLTIPVGGTFQPTVNTSVGAQVVNNGLTIVRGTTSFIAAYAGSAGSILRIISDPTCCAGIANFAANSSNAGTVELTSTNGVNTASLQIGAGFTFTNSASGVIAPLVGTGGVRSVTGAAGVLANAGTIDVSNGADLALTGNFNSTGTINVGAGRTLSIGAGGVTATFSGGILTGSGTIASLAGIMILNSAFAYAGPTVNITNTTVNGSAALSVTPAQTMTILNSTINTPVTNQGILQVRGAVPFNGAMTTVAGSTLRLQGDPGCCAALATFATGFTNNAIIELASINGSNTSTLVVLAGTLTNAAAGVIVPLTATGGARNINATLNNQGLIDMFPGSTGTLQIGGPFTNAGTINGKLASSTIYDRINLTLAFNMALGGTLNVALFGGYNPTAGTTSHLMFTTASGTISGTFGTTNLPNGLLPLYLPNSVSVK